MCLTELFYDRDLKKLSVTTYALIAPTLHNFMVVKMVVTLEYALKRIRANYTRCFKKQSRMLKAIALVEAVKMAAWSNKNVRLF
jgi:hypothetical protein